MFRFLIVALFSFGLYAAPPIEGGRDAPMASFDYIDIIKIKRADQGECSATRVSPKFILTAAHCVKGMGPGSGTVGMGKIVKVTVHPKYAAAKLAKQKKLTTLYDIALIEIEERPSKRTMPYPSIISSKTKLGPRKKMELAGYGLNQSFWNGSEYEFKATKANLQIADNDWEQCPLNYFTNEVESLAAFNKNLKEHLSIKAKRIHTIVNGHETLTYDGLGMLLPGDSGSPSIERDENNQFVVTGVASNITPYAEGSGEASFEIVVNGKVISSQKLPEMPLNWGYRNKLDVEFNELKSILKEQDLLDVTGNPKPGVVIKRQYTRVTEGRYADLSHPENQKFIQSIMGK